MKTWPSRFPTLDVAQPYHRNPEKIANRVYGGRMGNGTEETGDGWLYHGRGLIQLTGKDNYTLAGDALSMDFIHSPDYVLVPKYAALTAGWYWNKRNLNKEADAKDYTAMTKKINGGVIGLDDRIKHINHALDVLISRACVMASSANSLASASRPSIAALCRSLRFFSAIMHGYA